MSEPITLYCTAEHQYGGRVFVIGDQVALTAPSVVREFMASGHWSATPPDDPQVTPVEESQVPPKRGRRAKHA